MSHCKVCGGAVEVRDGSYGRDAFELYECLDCGGSGTMRITSAGDIITTGCVETD
jgi:hypothetical protein